MCMIYRVLIFLGVIFCSGCVPKEKIELRSIRNIQVEPAENGKALLKAEVVFYNPNNVAFVLQEIDMSVKVNGKNPAVAKQTLHMAIPPRNVFTVPLEVSISLKELGLFDTLMGLFGGKKYDLEFTGFIKVKVHGIRITFPIAYKDQLKLTR